MRKVLIVAGLLAVIIVSFAFVGLKIAANGADDNYFNRRWRQVFTQSSFFRQVIGLHYDGDARADYLGGRFERIAIDVKAEAGVAVDEAVLERFADKVSAITGKPASYQVSETLITQADAMVKQPAELALVYRKLYPKGRTAALFLLLLRSDAKAPDLLGSTLGEDGIILYVAALADFTRRSPATLPAYEFSTLLHEFGHQLGLVHNDLSDCLMSEHAERKGAFLQLARDVIVDFCPKEYAQIQTIKSSFNY